MSGRERLVIVGVALVAASSLAGCSMADSLKPVAGDKMNAVKFASIDVLMAQRVDILIAPVCTAPTSTTYSCQGETVKKEPIAVTAAEDPYVMKVTVADKEIYSGSVQDVLDAAGRVK